jgi:U2-associated protein SR140
MRENRRDLREQLKQKYGDDIEAIDRIAPSLDNPYLHGGGEYSDDPTTTNLYLANLPPDIELQDLYDTFGTFGPLASAKILYPRGESEHRVGSALSGFTAFMSRRDAERAILVMRGAKIGHFDIRVNWAKPVNLPSLVRVIRYIPSLF